MRFRWLFFAFILISSTVIGQITQQRFLSFELFGNYNVVNTNNESEELRRTDYSIGSNVCFGLRLAKGFFYFTAGYQFMQDTTHYVNNVQGVKESERLKASYPIVGLGVKRFFQFSQSPFYFNMDIALRYFMGNLNGLYSFEKINSSYPNPPSQAIEGQHAIVELGIRPGVTAFFNESMFAEISFGYCGVQYDNWNKIYAGGHDEYYTETGFKLDFTPDSFRFKLGFFF